MSFSSGKSTSTTHPSPDGNKRHRGEEVESDAIPFVDNIDVPTEFSTHILFGDHHVESYRLGTLSLFPAWAPIKIYDLARAGFYYLGFRDRVECFSCGINVENWILSDNALSASHHYPTCAMALGTDVMNIPLPTGTLYDLIREVIETIERRSLGIPIPVEVGQENVANDLLGAETQQVQDPEHVAENLVPFRPVVQSVDTIGDENGELEADNDAAEVSRADRVEEATGEERPDQRRGSSDSTAGSPAKKIRRQNRDPDQNHEE